MSKFIVSVERFIPYPAEQLFAIVANPAMHPLLDGSGTVTKGYPDNPAKLFLGATFGMSMKMVKKYDMQNTVVEYTENQRITWKPAGDYVWRYVFTPTNGGTYVREEWDARNAKMKWAMGLLGFPRRNRKGIERTLVRLEEIARDQASKF